MNPFVILLIQLINIYSYVLFSWMIIGILVYFNIINRYQPLVRKITEILDRVVEPALRPIRKYVPNIGGIDFSPLILALALQFITNSLIYYF